MLKKLLMSCSKLRCTIAETLPETDYDKKHRAHIEEVVNKYDEAKEEMKRIKKSRLPCR